ncbi:MAG TPA: acylphosphatase [Candidatus Limnocylindrales bacterium]|nr:acylphosphatase [Candidatus Limnocylindrales bacterium]
MSGPVRLEASIRGVVQGVGFRWFVMREAHRRELTGWVANEFDGSVRVVAEGPSAEIAAFRAALETGPPSAVVERVSAVEMPATGSFEEFSVRSGGHRGD